MVTNTLPSTMILTSIGYAGDRLTVSGRAPSEAEVTLYALSLNASSRFADVIIANMKKTEDDKMNFTLVMLPLAD
ncbi:PilN domain-containing protein [Chloroflexota bacterium]